MQHHISLRAPTATVTVDNSAANLVSCMLILFSMLFCGALLNKDSSSETGAWQVQA
jgi:hypothetical protein